MSDRPSLLVIGAARSGTSALAAFLGEHPEIAFTRPKETHFFAFAGSEVRFNGPGDEGGLNRVAITDPDEFATLCHSTGGRLVGEGSVTTMYHHERSIPNIRRYADDDVRLIAVLRNPVERAFSAFEYLRSRGLEPETEFGRALDLEERRRNDGWSHLWHLTAQGRYAEQLAPFIDEFGRDRVLVVLADDFRHDGQATLDTTFRFLGLDPVTVDAGREHNPGGVPRSRLVERAIGTVQRSRLRTVARRVAGGRVHRLVESTQFRRGTVPEPERRRLTELFAPEVTRLERLLDRDLGAWRVGGHRAEWRASS